MWAAANPAGSYCLSQQMEGPLLFFCLQQRFATKGSQPYLLMCCCRLSFLMTTKVADSENPGTGRHPEDQTVGNGDCASGLGLRLE